MKRIFKDNYDLLYYLNFGQLPKCEHPAGYSQGTRDLFGTNSALTPEKMKDKGQRKYCGCMISKDIGMYNTCTHFCVYCYANTSQEAVRKNISKHNVDSESIII